MFQSIFGELQQKKASTFGKAPKNGTPEAP